MSVTNDQNVVLDHIERLHLEQKRREQYRNHLVCRDRLLAGLHEIFLEVDHLARTEIGRDGLSLDAPGTLYFGVKSWPRVQNLFDWYSVSVVNLFMLTGGMADEFRRGDTVSLSRKYVERVCGPVLRHRNSRAGHIAAAEPEGDNDADVALSVMNDVSLEDRKFARGAVSLYMTRRGEFVQSDTRRWCLVDFHVWTVLARLRPESITQMVEAHGDGFPEAPTPLDG